MSNLNRIVRLPQVMDLTGLARSTIYAKISCNDFPGPIRLGPRAAGWVLAEIEQWIAERINARNGQ
ncbi:AlpA family transcriptional regulator [Methylogaea oryzae]|uniref:AlpA family transcriptional regulator n=1 Tax=Methylogaea oryzae TaxID=1295382 RepID=UPI001FE7A48A|nr:AlpA family transcriptional regulator [Methylogaea oryzae]